MGDLMINARHLLGLCSAAAEGRLDEAQQTAVASQVLGACATIPVIGPNMVRMAKARDWYGLVGAIGSYIDTMEATSPRTEVSATASATATADVRVQYDAAFRTIERTDGLSDETKERLEAILSELRALAEARETGRFSRRLADWLSLAADSATVVTSCAPLIASLLGMLGG